MTDALLTYHATRRRRRALIAALGVACLGALLAGLFIGPTPVAPEAVIAALLGRGDATSDIIVLRLRLPMALLGLGAGGALGLAGAEMQTVLANPLAEPYTIGVSSAAALGASLAIVLGVALPGLGGWAVPANAFLFSFGALLLIQLLARARGAGPDVLVLLGIGVGLAATAVLSLVQYVASADALQQLVFWIMGSLSRADWRAVAAIAVSLAVALPCSMHRARALTALRLGEERALAMGISTDRERLASLLRVSLLAGTAVAFIGIVGFVGLVAPHIARLCVGEDHRFLLPASCLVGALILSLAGLASVLLVPGAVIPVGIVTALVGLPVFFALVMR